MARGQKVSRVEALPSAGGEVEPEDVDRAHALGPHLTVHIMAGVKKSCHGLRKIAATCCAQKGASKFSRFCEQRSAKKPANLDQNFFIAGCRSG
jgi:hypothetical protein